MRKILRIVGAVAAVLCALAVLGGALFGLLVWSRESLLATASTTHPKMSRQDCIECHAPIAEEWRQSYHYRSLTGPFWKEVRELGYLKIFDKTRKACVNCHAPANVLDLADSVSTFDASGDQLGVECTPSLLREPRGTIPAARADDVELGVDCTSCHVSARGVVGAGRHPSAPHETIVDRRFQDPALTADALCRICHGATVAAWKKTTLPAAGVTCLECHMPRSTPRRSLRDRNARGEATASSVTRISPCWRAPSTPR